MSESTPPTTERQSWLRKTKLLFTTRRGRKRLFRGLLVFLVLYTGSYLILSRVLLAHKIERWEMDGVVYYELKDFWRYEPLVPLYWPLLKLDSAIGGWEFTFFPDMPADAS